MIDLQLKGQLCYSCMKNDLNFYIQYNLNTAPFPWCLAFFRNRKTFSQLNTSCFLDTRFWLLSRARGWEWPISRPAPFWDFAQSSGCNKVYTSISTFISLVLEAAGACWAVGTHFHDTLIKCDVSDAICLGRHYHCLKDNDANSVHIDIYDTFIQGGYTWGIVFCYLIMYTCALVSVINSNWINI